MQYGVRSMGPIQDSHGNMASATMHPPRSSGVITKVGRCSAHRLRTANICGGERVASAKAFVNAGSSRARACFTSGPDFGVVST